MADITSKLSFYDREDRPWPLLRLTSSAIVGHVTQTTARVWVRVHKPGAYCLIVSSGPIDSRLRPELDESKTLALIGDGNSVQSLPDDTKVLHAKEISFDDDNTYTFNVKGLKKDTRYYYALFDCADRSEKWEVGRDSSHSFRTQPSTLTSISFGLYSCHMPFKGRTVRNMEMWESFHELLEDTNARFVIGCGDQVYADGTKRLDIWRWLKKNKDEMSELSNEQQIKVMTSWYRDIYRGYWGDLNLRKVYRNFPNYMIWDDHEIMDGWGSYTEDELSNELDTIWEREDREQNLRLAYNMFEAAKVVYNEYEHSHNPDTEAGQWDYNFQWPQLPFFVLDMRGYRDYDEDPKKGAILGKEQWKRFSAWIKSTAVERAAAVFIVSPVPVVHVSSFVVNKFDLPALGIADDLRDEWEHESNHIERNRLLKEVFDFSERTGKPVIFLSGDVHLGAAFKLVRHSHLNARVFQLTSSAITYAGSWGRLLKLVVREKGKIEGLPDAERTSFKRLHLFESNNFGLIHVRKEPRKPAKIHWDLYGASGEEGQILKLKRITLS